MKKYLILTLMVLVFLSCNRTIKEEEPVLELISYRWSSYNNYTKLANGEWGDTIIIYIKRNLYAKIYGNGNCLITKQKGPYEEDLYSTFKIDTAIINPVLRVFNTISIDTIMIKKTEPGSHIYDGPFIRLFGKGQNKKELSIGYNTTEYSNSNLVRLYKFINLKSDTVGSNENLFQSKDKRMKDIYDKEFDEISKIEINKTIQFSIPDIK